MNFSTFGQKFTQNTGILQLMKDLGDALNSEQPINMLGGGNPARIDEVNAAFLKVYQSLAGELVDSTAIDTIGNYANPQGDKQFIDSMVDFLNRHYDWGLTADNIALTNGSQNAFFYLFNLFAGEFTSVDSQPEAKPTHKSILLPLAPEYIGYADVQVSGKHFVAVSPIIDTVTHEGEPGFFKYRVDFDALENLPALHNNQIGAICCSRPTNPTGNVLTDAEMARLSALAKQHGIPLIIDNAYGMPFPNIIYSDVTLNWDDNTILCCSLSKVGLPGVRTGIVVAHPKVIAAISSLNAIVNLAPTRFGAAIAKPLLVSDELKHLSDQYIQPFYQQKAKRAIELIKQHMGKLFVEKVKIHQPEGAIFLWLWFKDLPISTSQLYEMLKQQGTLIIPGEQFFIGIEQQGYAHAHECIRMSIAQDDDTLVNGITTIAKVVHALYSEEA